MTAPTEPDSTVDHEFVEGWLSELCSYYQGGDPSASWSYCGLTRSKHRKADEPLSRHAREAAEEWFPHEGRCADRGCACGAGAAQKHLASVIERHMRPAWEAMERDLRTTETSRDLASYRFHCRPTPDHPRTCREQDPCACHRIERAEAALAEAQEERDDLQATFDLRWKADMRAIKAWQEAHPGNDLVWPDHADLCVWLMAALDRVRANVRKVYVGGDEANGRSVYVDHRGQRYGQGPTLWAVVRLGTCLNKGGKWEWEPQPSSRTDAFIERCRWTDFDAAMEAALANLEKENG